MTVTVRNMAGNALVATASTAVFTVSAGAKDVIRGAIAYAATAAVLTLDKVPSGVTAVSTSTRIGIFNLTAQQSRVMSELLNQVFEAGDGLWASTSVTSAIALQIGGARIT